MQRYILTRGLQSIFALWAMSLIVFSLARITGNPLDILLPLEATAEQYDRVSAQWGLDEPLHVQYFVFLKNAVKGDFGDSLRWTGESAMGLVMQRIPATLSSLGSLWLSASSPPCPSASFPQ